MQTRMIQAEFSAASALADQQQKIADRRMKSLQPVSFGGFSGGVVMISACGLTRWESNDDKTIDIRTMVPITA